MFENNNFISLNIILFLLLVRVIILFFLLVVFDFIFYILYINNVSHFIGHLKRIAESYAFIFSSISLGIMVIPSIMLLYDYSSQNNVDILVKIVGSQWYWNYELRNIFDDSISIYMLSLDDINIGDILFLEVDNKLILSNRLSVILNITSSDVIHSFSLTSLGLKVDATPGLLCVLTFDSLKMGTYIGQCREICGINHSFIPFVLEVTRIMSFLNYYFNL